MNLSLSRSLQRISCVLLLIAGLACAGLGVYWTHKILTVQAFQATVVQLDHQHSIRRQTQTTAQGSQTTIEEDDCYYPRIAYLGEDGRSINRVFYNCNSNRQIQRGQLLNVYFSPAGEIYLQEDLSKARLWSLQSLAYAGGTFFCILFLLRSKTPKEAV